MSVVLIAVALLASASAPAEAGRTSAITVLERSCFYPTAADLNTPWIATAPGGLRVELRCGTRIEVSGGRCRIRIGDELAEVPCIDRRGP